MALSLVGSSEPYGEAKRTRLVAEKAHRRRVPKHQRAVSTGWWCMVAIRGLKASQLEAELPLVNTSEMEKSEDTRLSFSVPQTAACGSLHSCATVVAIRGEILSHRSAAKTSVAFSLRSTVPG